MCYQKCVTRENEPSKRKIEVLDNQDITQVKTWKKWIPSGSLLTQINRWKSAVYFCFYIFVPFFVPSVIILFYYSLIFINIRGQFFVDSKWITAFHPNYVWVYLKGIHFSPKIHTNACGLIVFYHWFQSELSLCVLLLHCYLFFAQ